MEDIKFSLEQARIYIIFINIILGFLFGTFPLLAGLRLNNRKYGVYGLIGATIGGAILGVFLSFPIAAILTWLILKKSFANEGIDAAAVSATSAEIDSAEKF